MTTFDSAATRWRRRATCALASTAMITAGFVAFADTANAASATIYVDVQGADSATCGNVKNQCATIKQGITNAKAGDTVLVGAGTYNESIDITTGITVKSADGADTTTIDGAGLTLPNGLVNITDPKGDVTFTGFTVKNQTASPNGDSFAVTINDATTADTITISGNKFPGKTGATATDSLYGVDSANTAATQVITGNEFSGMWRGILLEGSRGRVDVSTNVFHDLVSTDTGNGDSKTYPPKGIYFLADANVAATNQNVTNNEFSSYGGIGVSYRAGYNLGGCSARVCLGSISGTATGNTFNLDAPPATNVTDPNQQGAAFNVQALFAGDKVDLTAGGNTGTVTAPTQPFVEVPSPGTTTITPGDTPNTIVPAPEPTVTLTSPGTLATDGTTKTFTATATNTSSVTSPNARYGVTITGTQGIKAGQLKLEYATTKIPTAADFKTVTLSGTASSGGAITGYVGPAAGSSTVSDVVTFRLSFPADVTTPPDTLATTVSLDQVSSGTGNPVINTVATSNTTSTTVLRHVTTTLTLSSPSKGQLIANISTSPARPGTMVAYYFVHGKSVDLYRTIRATSKGTAAIAIKVTSGSTYTMQARIYADPGSDAAYSAPQTLRAK